MNPFFFGPSARPLFGAYHPPQGPKPRPTAVVVCNPLGQEQMRTHRALRQLALQLARSGYPVLRFDYYGTGDSAGLMEETRLADIVEGVGHAADEARETAGVSRVSLVGIRLGATAAYLASRARADVQDLVLWDPVVSGPAYVGELRIAAGPAGESSSRTLGVYGFPVTRGLQEDLEAVDLLQGEPCRAARVIVVDSSEREESGALLDRLARAGIRTVRHYIPRGGDWEDMDRFGAALLPHEIIQAIVAELN